MSTATFGIHIIVLVFQALLFICTANMFLTFYLTTKFWTQPKWTNLQMIKIKENILPLFLQILPYLEALERHTTSGWTIWVTQGEVVYIYKILEKTTKIVLENGLLTHYQTTNFRLFQPERVCRWPFQIWWKWQKVIQTGRKHWGKRRNCSLRAISPFLTVFSKSLFPRGVKRRHCVGMG